jgi:hypothetical protein
MYVFLSPYLKPADFDREWNKFGCRDQIGINLFTIRWLAAARDAYRRLSVGRNALDSFERGRLFGITRLR